MLDVGTIYHEPTVPDFPRGREIFDRFPDADRVVVPSHWNIAGLHGNEGRAEDWLQIKKTTLVLGVPQAPFAGVGHGDDTVIVFVPNKYRFHADEGVSALVHFHGHNSSAERAIAAHALREQLVDSRQNAILVVPQLALFAADSSCGKLTTPGALSRLLGGALSTAARVGRSTLGDSRFPERPRLGRVCVSAHSVGYHAAACSLRAGGVDRHTSDGVSVLFVRTWVASASRREAIAQHRTTT